jgi:cell division septation protein DedD
MSRERDGPSVLDRLRSRRWAVYAVWVAVLVVSFAAGGTTLGLLVDHESVGTEDDPNRIQVVGNWAGFAPANDQTNETGVDADAQNTTSTPTTTPTPTPTSTPTPTPTSTPTPTPTSTPTPTPTPDCPGNSEQSGSCPPGEGTGPEASQTEGQ